jgi:hypothetical protein
MIDISCEKLVAALVAAMREQQEKNNELFQKLKKWRSSNHFPANNSDCGPSKA